MIYRNFDELIAKQKARPNAARMAVAAAGDEHTIEAVLHARAEGIVRPILVGDKTLIDAALEHFGQTRQSDIFVFVRLCCHCEPVRTLAWQSASPCTS